MRSSNHRLQNEEKLPDASLADALSRGEFARPAVFVVLVVFVAPAGFAVAAGFAVPEVFAGSAFLVVRARELARAELAVRTGVAVSAAFFVGGTDLPPIWIS